MLKIRQIPIIYKIMIANILIFFLYACANNTNQNKEKDIYFGLSDLERRNKAKKWAQDYLSSNHGNSSKHSNYEFNPDLKKTNNIRNAKLDEAWEKLRDKVKRIRKNQAMQKNNISYDIVKTEPETIIFQEMTIDTELEKNTPEINENFYFEIDNPVDQEKNVKKTLEKWAESWSSKDVDSYLSFYDVSFKLPKGMTWKLWKQERINRLKKEYINIQLSDIKIIFISENLASTTFIQDYVSNNYSDKSKKHILLKKIGTEWHIIREQELKSRL